jgi:hypothetical protein
MYVASGNAAQGCRDDGHLLSSLPAKAAGKEEKKVKVKTKMKVKMKIKVKVKVKVQKENE